ncbi:hypothetical protein LCGC14_1269740 [marine sediment metagenome]|uniref:Uncharacterized protein n=1 Tax=marine sediment metagenome TaxID=412755 RepID=A0A0F9LJF7_9ZZZZ
MAEERPYVQYPFRSPRMDQSVPPNQVRVGSCGRLAGVDGRFNGGIRKYYGNRKVLDIDDVAGMGAIDTYDGPSYFKSVTFQKRNTSTVYRGFVIRWDSQDDNANEQVDLIYTNDNGSTWNTLAIWAVGNSITSSLEMTCAVDAGYLLIAVDGKATRTVVWNGATLVAVDSGPGAFDVELGAQTLSSASVDTSYQLNGAGTFQVAFRFYDSVRGIYSALSESVTIHLDLIQTTKALGTVSFSAAGGDSGLMIAGDIVTINGRTYEYIDAGSDVTIPVAAGATIAQHAQVLADTINGDASAEVTATAQATSVLLESILRGTAGNAYTLAKTETGGNTNDLGVSGATLSSGGQVTTVAEPQCKAVIDFPDNASVVSGKTYTDFDDLFDTVDVFRTINLGNSVTSQGAIFYLEQTIAKSGNWATSGAWDSLQVSVGTVVDEALPFLTMYDPEKDIVSSPPQSGTIGRYEGQTYMAQAASVDGGYDTLFSSSEHASPEYFSTYNRRKGDPDDGRPLQFIPAGDSMFQLSYNAVVHIFKSGKLKPILINRLHRKRGLVGKDVAHSSGNSIFMISGLGITILNASDGSMGTISSADRVIFDDWKNDLAEVKSCNDALMNASFWLNATREEMLVVWHSTQTSSMLDGANFVDMSSGPDITGGKNDRAYFITKQGLIVSPDAVKTGSGTMFDISDSYTINGTATATGATLTNSNATLHADMVGAKLYVATGENAGLGRTVAIINDSTKVVTFESAFPYDIATGDTYSVSPVPFTVRAWPLQDERISRFNRWITEGVSVKASRLEGFTGNPNNKWRIGAYRNGGSSLEATTAYMDVSANPPDSAEGLNIDGIDIEPYFEQLAAGVSFELMDAEISIVLTDSRQVSDS